jgi:hypothetical protein
VKLSRREREILTRMLADVDGEEGELTEDNGAWWLGYERISPRIARRFVQLGLIRVTYTGQNGYSIWSAKKSDVQQALGDPSFMPEITEHLPALVTVAGSSGGTGSGSAAQADSAVAGRSDPGVQTSPHRGR